MSRFRVTIGYAYTFSVEAKDADEAADVGRLVDVFDADFDEIVPLEPIVVDELVP